MPESSFQAPEARKQLRKGVGRSRGMNAPSSLLGCHAAVKGGGELQFLV